MVDDVWISLTSRPEALANQVSRKYTRCSPQAEENCFTAAASTTQQEHLGTASVTKLFKINSISSNVHEQIYYPGTSANLR